MHDLLIEVRAALAPTILMVTHDLDEAALAESTVVLIEGGVHQHAPMAEIYQRPASVAVARLLGGFAEVAGTVRDGVHHSSWGRVPVAVGAAGEGPAVLLVRRESLRLQLAGGRTTAAGLGARVVRSRPTGTRVVVSVVGDDGSPLEVELPIGEHVRPGSRVWVMPPDSGGQRGRCAKGHPSGTPRARRPISMAACTRRGCPWRRPGRDVRLRRNVLNLCPRPPVAPSASSCRPRSSSSPPRSGWGSSHH